MADVNKIKLPNNTVVNIKDYRISGIDTVPTSGSANVVSSSGVYSMITQNEQDVSQELNNINNRVSQIEDGTISSDRLTQQEVINLLNL